MLQVELSLTGKQGIGVWHPPSVQPTLREGRSLSVNGQVTLSDMWLTFGQQCHSCG